MIFIDHQPDDCHDIFTIVFKRKNKNEANWSIAFKSNSEKRIGPNKGIRQSLINRGYKIFLMRSNR